MAERKLVRERIDIGHEAGGDIFAKFKAAWLRVPEDQQATAKLSDDQLSYDRPETDAEMNVRIIDEELQAKLDAELLAIKQSSHLASEIYAAVGSQLMAINQQWESIKTGQSMQTEASVPMPDGRLAAVNISVTAVEQVKSVD